MRRLAFVAIVVLLGLGALGLAFRWRLRGNRYGYRTLATDLFHPTFFPRYAAARQERAGWVRSAPDVALTYVGWSRLCRDQQVSHIPAPEGQAIIVVTQTCPYTPTPVRQYRVELVWRADAWEIEWAGMRLKCAVNKSPLGAYLIKHNPFSNGRLPWLQPLDHAFLSMAASLNPWLPVCL